MFYKSVLLLDGPRVHGYGLEHRFLHYDGNTSGHARPSADLIQHLHYPTASAGHYIQRLGVLRRKF
jgi:hypothetical protein